MNTHVSNIKAKKKAAKAEMWENIRPGGVPPGIVCDIEGESWDITDDINPVLRALLAELKEAREKLEAVDRWADDFPDVQVCELLRILKKGE